MAKSYQRRPARIAPVVRTISSTIAFGSWYSKDPVHSVVGARDEAVQGHRHVPDHTDHIPDPLFNRARRCASSVKCAIATRGTKKEGINANGRRCISAVFVPAVNPGQRYSVPRRTASTKSAIPKRFQVRNVVLKRNPSSAATRATIQGALAAIAISPSPAGQAKPPGNIPSAYAIRNPRPMNLQPFRAIKNTGGTETTRARQREDRPKPNTNKRIGTRKASASTRGSSFGRVTNTPRAASNRAAANQRIAPQSNGMCLSVISTSGGWTERPAVPSPCVSHCPTADITSWAVSPPEK